MQKILVILGPTTSGKSDLAVSLAKKYNGEIISADSRQVYRGLNIGAGKITKKEMRGVPHHLLDVANPQRRFTVARFKSLGEKAIDSILEKNKLPIVCGGTGFYISALVDGIVFPDVLPDSILRKKLAKETTTTLFKTLQKLDPVRAQHIDSLNKVRLIRAIEIASALGSVPKVTSKSHYIPLFIGIRPNDTELKGRIEKRLLKRIKTGMAAEAKKLHERGLTWKRMEELGLEYRYLARFLQKKITKEEMITHLKNEIWHFAKRQMTWFKRDKRIAWYTTRDLNKIEKNIKTFLK